MASEGTYCKAPTLKGVEFLVECSMPRISGATVWETIAAFNVDAVAIQYGKSCATSNPENKYRVWRKRSKIGPLWDNATSSTGSPHGE